MTEKMRRISVKNVLVPLSLMVLTLLASCQEEIPQGIAVSQPKTVEVGFYAGGHSTRTEMLPNGLTAEWSDGDQVAMWALNSSNVYTLNQQVFTTYAVNESKGFFTTTLSSAMPSDDYTYYCCYPVPNSISGTTAGFYLSAYQDGKVSGGADIMIATPVQHGPLAPLPEVLDHSGLALEMNRMLHQFRFWIPADQDIIPSSPIQRILLTFPTQVVGEVVADISDPSSSAKLKMGYSRLDIDLADPISAQKQNYACVSIVPTKFNEGDKLQITAYTADKLLLFEPVDLCARNCQAGHSTPVKLKIKQETDIGRFRFRISENNLGENPTSVTLTAPAGCVWGDTGSNVFTYSPGREIKVGETFEILFENISDYWELSRQKITVSFDSEHVTTSETITLPDMSSLSSVEVSGAVPYLLYEDFSTVSSFSSHDEYKTSSAGSKDAYSFLNGWTGGRIGASAGKCIRIACRRETSVDYHARVDSAPIISLKKSAKIAVTFDYGMNNRFGGIYITPPDMGQTFFVGYVTGTGGYKSGSTSGTFESVNKRYIFEKSGSYDSTPNTDTYYLNNVPTGNVRISWRTEIEHRDGANNTTCWLYIDNVKVQIAK